MPAYYGSAESPFQGFERAPGQNYIAVGELLVGMAEADDDILALASDDEEGNEFRPFGEITQGLYVPQRTWCGLYWPHPDEHTTMDARMLYERMVAGRDDSLEATLLASVDPDVVVEEPLKWGEVKSKLLAVDPSSIAILRHHTWADLFDHPPSYSPLVEVDPAYYLQGECITVDMGGFDGRIPAERINPLHLEDDDEETRQYVEEALKDPGIRPAYFFWPLN